MVINGEGALPSSSVNNALETTKGGTYFGILGVKGNDVKRRKKLEESIKEFMNVMKQATCGK